MLGHTRAACGAPNNHIMEKLKDFAIDVSYGLYVVFNSTSMSVSISELDHGGMQPLGFFFFNNKLIRMSRICTFIRGLHYKC